MALDRRDPKDGIIAMVGQIKILLLTLLAERADADVDPAQAIRRWEGVISACRQADIPVPAKVHAGLQAAGLKQVSQSRRSGDLKAAETVLEGLLAETPQELVLLTRFAEMATAREQWDQAVSRWERVGEAAHLNALRVPEKTPAALRSARLKRVAELRHSGDDEAAEAILKRIIADAPDDTVAMTHLAEMASARKDWAQAVRRWSRTVRTSEDNRLPIPTKALNGLKSSRLNLAVQLQETAAVEAAEEVLGQILAADPGDLTTLIRLAEIAVARGEWKRAVSRWERVIAAVEQTQAPLPAKAARGLRAARLKHASQLRSANEIEAAEAVIEQMLGEAPEDVTALTRFAELAVVHKDWKRAVERWQNRLDAQPDNPTNALLKLSIAHDRRGDLDKAISLLQGAIACRFSDQQMIVQLARYHCRENEWEKAAALIRDVIDEETIVHHLKDAAFAARVFWRVGDLAQASSIIERALSVNPPEAIGVDIQAIAEEIRQRLDSKAPIDSSEVSQTYYDNIYRDSKKYQAKARDSIYLPVWEKIDREIGRAGHRRIMDLGCGPGQFAEFILRQRPTVTYTGVDFSEVAIQQAQRRCPQASFRVANLMERDAFSDWEYDVIVILEVLEHIEDDIALLDRLSGTRTVIASVPNFDSFSHVRFFKSVEQIAARYGHLFSDLHLTPISIGDNALIYLMIGTTR